MRLTRYSQEYLEPMLALHRSAIVGFALGMSQQEDEADLMAIEQVYLGGGGEFLLGFIDERLVAMGGFKRHTDTSAELRRMRIERELQGKGYGGRLLRELERLAFQSGIRTLCLDTARRRSLTLEFYRKHGYQETGRGSYGAVETVQFSKALSERTGDYTKHTVLKDGWTHDPDYRRCYQTEDDVETILSLLALGPDSTLADIGCGNGAFALAAAQKHPGCRVRAFDALDSAVAQCKARADGLSNLQAEVAWAHSIPLASGSVDRALFRSVLHHIAEPQAVYAEISRLLKPGGRLVLQAPCNYWESAFGVVLSGMMMLSDDSHRRFYYQPAEIVEGLQRAGFCVREPECWTYSFPFVDDKQARFIRQHQAEERLHLQPLEPGRWSIENCWVRVVGEKRGPEGSAR